MLGLRPSWQVRVFSRGRERRITFPRRVKQEHPPKNGGDALKLPKPCLSCVHDNNVVLRGIAVVEHDAIMGFNASHLYSVERLVNYPHEKASHLGKTLAG